MAMQRLRQVFSHLIGGGQDANALSLVHGPKVPELVEYNLSQLLERQVERFPDRDAIVVPWTDARLSFRQLLDRSKELARGLAALGVGVGDRVGILSGNCEEFVELFFAVGRLGGILVVLNPAYTPVECENTLRHSGAKLFFTTTWAGRKSTIPLLEKLVKDTSSLPELERVFLIRGDNPFPGKIETYQDVLARASSTAMETIEKLKDAIDCQSVCVLMYTSGTTGDPKAAMLTH